MSINSTGEADVSMGEERIKKEKKKKKRNEDETAVTEEATITETVVSLYNCNFFYVEILKLFFFF